MNPPIITPTLLVDKSKVLANIQQMAAKAKRNGVQFRPHFKTHQSQEVGRWFRNLGVTAITVSSLKMAEYFAADGWLDITVAFPTNILEIDRINALAEKITLNLVVESTETITLLKNKVTHPINVFLKIDAGYHRTGIDFADTIYISQLLQQLHPAKNLHFSGFLAHAGHSYKARGAAEILEIHQQSKERLTTLKEFFLHHFPNLVLSVRDTPSC